MTGDSGKLRVFVSSTSEDLRDFRAAARHVMLDLGMDPEMMEHFGASSLPTVDACRGKLESCDLVVLLCAFRRGWVPTQEQGGNGVDSMTALELRHARERKIPVLAMLGSGSWPGNLWEDEDEARKWVRRFREGLNLPAVYFDYEKPAGREGEALPIFRASVRQLLLTFKEERLARRAAGQVAGGGIDFFDRASEGLAAGREIPFIGAGIYADGPLSPASLGAALGGRKPAEGDGPLATLAEYRERFLNDRERFLALLKTVLVERRDATPPVPVYELLASLELLPVVISATWDDLLEKRLRAAGRSFAVMGHVIRSVEGEHDGKIAVARSTGEVELFKADEINLEGIGCLVYKPLGSLALNRALKQRFGADEAIDTVVITETDHAIFFGLLQNAATKPVALLRQLRRRPLLFLGYTLDVWQFRLVVQVIEMTGSRLKSPVAVRVPGSPIEEVAWQRLGTDLIRLDPAEFARRMLAGRAAPAG